MKTFKNFKEGMKVTCSVKELYENCKNGLQENTIDYSSEDDGREYFDMYNNFNEICCMDGETCEIIDIDEWIHHIRLKNSDGEKDAYFSLTFDEAEIGLTVNVNQD